MPGIITHNRVFAETINHIKKDKQNSIYAKSIEILLNTDSSFKAGTFGAAGPDIFNHLPFKKINLQGGSEISYQLHTSRNEKFLKSMLLTLMSYKDQNTEWASIQRAYFYGFISHLISDSIFHPFIYYWAGFTHSNNKKEMIYFREQHLLFENNMDLFFSNSFDDNHFNKFNFNPDYILPTIKNKRLKPVERAVKTFLLNAIKESYPVFYKNLTFIKDNNTSKWPGFFIIDILPFFIKLHYNIKKSRNRKLLKLINYIKKKNIFYSDWLTAYPPTARLNTHVLNLHKERWFHPAGTSGLHYESAKDLLNISCAKTAEVWEKIEAFLINGKINISEIENYLIINSITGIKDKDYESMKIQNPVHLRF